MRHKRSKRDMAYHLDVDVSTLYNWRKHKPNLYRIVMLGFKFDEIMEAQKRLSDELNIIEGEICDEIREYAPKIQVGVESKDK